MKATAWLVVSAQHSIWKSRAQSRLRFSGERVAVESRPGLGGVPGQVILKNRRGAESFL